MQPVAASPRPFWSVGPWRPTQLNRPLADNGTPVSFHPYAFTADHHVFGNGLVHSTPSLALIVIYTDSFV